MTHSIAPPTRPAHRRPSAAAPPGVPAAAHRLHGRADRLRPRQVLRPADRLGAVPRALDQRPRPRHRPPGDARRRRRRDRRRHPGRASAPRSAATWSPPGWPGIIVNLVTWATTTTSRCATSACSSAALALARLAPPPRRRRGGHPVTGTTRPPRWTCRPWRPRVASAASRAVDLDARREGGRRPARRPRAADVDRAALAETPRPDGARLRRDARRPGRSTSRRSPTTRGTTSWCSSRTSRSGRCASTTCCRSSGSRTSATCPATGSSGCRSSPGWSSSSPRARRPRSG